MPLAMAQAAAYVRQRGSRCSVRQYTEKLEESRRSRTSLLSRDDRFLSRDWQASSSILLTWQISFEHLHKIRESAAELLALMSFCDRQAMPELLLRDLSDGEELIITGDGGDNKEEQSIMEFDDDIIMLQSLAFVSETADTKQWEMHRLVQDATRMWLERSGQLARVEKKFVHHLYRIFPDGSYETWAKCQALFPHTKAAAEKRPPDREALLEWASLMSHAAFYAYLQGKATDAMVLAKGSMEARVQELGKDNSHTLASMRMVGNALRDLGRWKETEKLEVLILETSKRVLGAEHRDTLSSMGNLAGTYRNQERWREAEELEVIVMETRKRVLGAEHPDTLRSMSHLAATYHGQGRWREAEELEVVVMETRKRVLGAEHPNTLASMGNLATTYQNQGRCREAEELLVIVMETSKKVLGAEHPNTLASMNNLAVTYWKQGRREAAKALLVQVVEKGTTVLGEQDPRMKTPIANLSVIMNADDEATS